MTPPDKADKPLMPDEIWCEYDQDGCLMAYDVPEGQPAIKYTRTQPLAAPKLAEGLAPDLNAAIKTIHLMYPSPAGTDALSTAIRIVIQAAQRTPSAEKIGKVRSFLANIVSKAPVGGVQGATWGDTKFDSASVAYGFNECLESFQEEATEALALLAEMGE